MKKINIVLVLFGISVLLLSCSSGEMTGKTELGNYFYRSYDIVGNLIGEGSLYIVKTDSGTVEGNWSIRNVHNCFTCGTQFGGGYLMGEIKKLNPDNPENYTELVGKLEADTISGDWQWFRLILASNRGTFEAAKL